MMMRLLTSAQKGGFSHFYMALPYVGIHRKKLVDMFVYDKNIGRSGYDNRMTGTPHLTRELDTNL
jgi:hypothetical protein